MLATAREYWERKYPGRRCNITQAMREYAASISASPLPRRTKTQYGRTADAPLKKCQCGSLMHITESDRDGYESVLVCPECENREYSELSIADYLRAISADREEKHLDDIDEIRASAAVRIERREICASCENNADGRCRVCGCRIRHRTYYKILPCPKDRWLATD